MHFSLQYYKFYQSLERLYTSTYIYIEMHEVNHGKRCNELINEFAERRQVWIYRTCSKIYLVYETIINTYWQLDFLKNYS